MKRRYIRNWYKTAYTALDYDEVDEYGNPVATQGLLADDNFDRDEEEILRNRGIEQEYNEEIERAEELVQEEEEDYFEDVDKPWEPPDIAENSPDTANKMEALKNAIENKRVLEIRYSPAGRGNRVIDFGKSVKRVIEPHSMYQAGNGNTILTTWDRSVGAIRAFIVDRIQNIVFRDNATRNPFKQRQYVLPSYERGNAMANANKSLTKILSKISDKQVQNAKGFNLSKIKNAEEGNGASKKRIDRTVQRARELAQRRERAKKNEERYQDENPPAETPSDDTDFSLDKARQQAVERGKQLGEERQRERENEEKYRKKNPEGSNINSSLMKIASELKDNGLSKSAAVISGVNKVLDQMKKAQYVGFQGQAIRNRRCWDNCYRNKRTETPKKSAQVVWFECWDEYLKSLKNSDKWDKYASIDKLAKDEKWNQKFSKEVKKKMKTGMSIPEAMYDTLNKEDEKHIDMIIKQASDLTELAVALNNNGYENIAIKVAETSNEILKEAQFGGGWEGAWNKVRRYNPFSGKSRSKGLAGDISTRIKRITQQALKMTDTFNTLKQQATQAGKPVAPAVPAVPAIQPAATGAGTTTTTTTTTTIIKEAAMGDSVSPGLSGVPGTTGENVPAQQAQQVQQTQLQGASDFVREFREEFFGFVTNLRTESTEMGQMARKNTDPAAQQMAAQASQRIMDFVNTVAPLEQSFGKIQELISQGPTITKALSSFADDMNKIQMQDYDPAAGDAATDPRAEFDTNQDNSISPPEAAASGADADSSQTIELDEVAAAPKSNTKELIEKMTNGTATEQEKAEFKAFYEKSMKGYNRFLKKMEPLYQKSKIKEAPKEAPAGMPQVQPYKPQQQLSNSMVAKSLLRNILNKNRGITKIRTNTI